MRACEDSSSLLELRIQDNPFGFRFSLFRALPCRDMSIQPCQVPLLKWWILHPFAIQHGQGYVGYHSGGIRWLSFVGGHECTWLPCHFCSSCEQIFCLVLPFVICVTTFGVLSLQTRDVIRFLATGHFANSAVRISANNPRHFWDVPFDGVRPRIRATRASENRNSQSNKC